MIEVSGPGKSRRPWCCEVCISSSLSSFLVTTINPKSRTLSRILLALGAF